MAIAKTSAVPNEFSVGPDNRVSTVGCYASSNNPPVSLQAA